MNESYVCVCVSSQSYGFFFSELLSAILQPHKNIKLLPSAANTKLSENTKNYSSI